MPQSPRRLPRTRSATVVVPASAASVWSVLADVTRVGEWSHEARGGQWTKGAGSEVGNVFRGSNKLGWIRWSRRCTIVESVPGQRLVYVTDGGLAGDATRWSFELTAAPDGTRITESYEILAMPRWMDAAVARLMPSHLDRSAAMTGDLERLGALADSQPGPPA